ncbi:M96 mating-specific protein [Phytophthora megakarya]|uniref:M96 mating-specific protein n=1 Tax=Phytophthora megakarya TaxID=4795 RepID=A0A225W596_9STRA|nr:M96 mating-specific protein [Phytophthora megakarya]
MAKSLEKMLTKRTSLRVSSDSDVEKKVNDFLLTMLWPAIFARLEKELETALDEVDVVFEAIGLARMEKTYADAQVRRENGTTVMEIFANKVVPFSVEATSHAVWEHFVHSMDHIPSRFVYQKQLKKTETTDDTLMESFGLELVGSRNATAAFRVRQIRRKFVQPHRVVIAWPMYSEALELSAEPTKGVRLHEKCFTVVKALPNASGRRGALIQSCYVLRPEIYGHVADRERILTTLTDFLLDSVSHTISSSHQMIENYLLDGALRFRADPNVLTQVASQESAAEEKSLNAGMSGGGEVIEDDELESLLLEVGLSNSPNTSSGVKTEPATNVATSQTASPTDSTVLSIAANGEGNINESARRGPRVGAQPAASGKTKKRVRLNPNRARDNRKNELAYLRNKVKQMEEQLQSLRQQYIENKDSTNTTTAPRSIVNTVGMPPVWRDMASTQQLRREKAERENARLKLVLESQIKLAKSMEAVMQRRTRQQLAGFNGVVSDVVGDVDGSTWDLLLDKDTYDMLLDRAEAAYHEVDDVLAANGLKYLETACTNAQMREGPEGMYVDIFTNKMLPFDFNTAAEAVWTHFRGSEKHRGNLYENFSKDVESSSDTVAEMFAIEFMANDLAADFRVKQVVRRYIEEDRQVVVWVSTASALENSKSKSPFASFGFREKGYVISKRVRGRDDFSMFQTCCLVSPQMSEGGSFDLSTVGTFTEFVLSFMFATITSSQQLIENMLMDQSLNPTHKNASP